MPTLAAHRESRAAAERSHTIRRGGLRLRIRVTPGRGRPVMLLHGYMDCSAGWRDYVQVTHRPCYAIDLPGHGDSSLAAHPTLDAFADMVAWAFDEWPEELGEAILVGHSLGGAVAARIADRWPQRALSLVLVEPVGYGRIRLAETCARQPVRSLLAAGLPFAMANPLLSGVAYAVGVSGGRPMSSDMHLRLAGRAATAARGAEQSLRLLAGLSGQAARCAISRSSYHGPVTAVFGTRDRLVPVSHRDGVLAAFPHAHVETWHGLAHHPQMERPEQLEALIERGAARARSEARRRRRERHRAPAPQLAAA